MTLTASDVSSLSQTLNRWEIGEYVSEAFVILACAGEMVADFGERWLGESRKRRVERHSTTLLVAALSVSLICLVRTNELSGNVIGSLGRTADEADQKAKTAISDSSIALVQAKDALSKAGAAETSLGKAESEATNAQTASSNALTLARGARQEADSFEQDIALANKKAEDVAKQLAPRTLNPADWEAIGDKLKPFSSRLVGRKVVVTSYSQDAEGIVFSVEISKVFERAGIDIDPVIGRLVPVGLVDVGVNITGPVKDAEFIALLAREIHDRADTDVHAEWNDKYNDVRVEVGSKPIAGLPKVVRPN